MDAQSYSIPARLLHWAVAVLVLLQLPLSFASDWTKGSLSNLLLDQHVRIGLLILALMVLRLILALMVLRWSWRVAVPPPLLPSHMAKWHRRVAGTTHRLLYLLLFAMPLTGYVLWAWTGPDLDWWGMGEVPVLFRGGDDEFWRSVAGYAHEYGGYFLSALLALHVGAALHHQLVVRDGLIPDRMGFGRRRTR